MKGKIDQNIVEVYIKFSQRKFNFKRKLIKF